MASDGARTARLIALMAGNGFAVVRLLNNLPAILTKNHEFPWLTLAALVVPMVGIAAAYLALCGEAGSRGARVSEQISLFILTVMMAGIIWLAASTLGLISGPQLHSP